MEEELEFLASMPQNMIVRENKNLGVRRKEKELKIAESILLNQIEERKVILQSLLNEINSIEKEDDDIFSANVITKSDVERHARVINSKVQIPSNIIQNNIEFLEQAIKLDSPITQNRIFSTKYQQTEDKYQTSVQSNNINSTTQLNTENKSLERSKSPPIGSWNWKEKVTPSNSPQKPKIYLSPRVPQTKPSEPNSPNSSPSIVRFGQPPNVANAPNTKIQMLKKMIEEEGKVLSTDIERMELLREENAMAHKEYHMISREIKKLLKEIPRLRKELLRFSADPLVEKSLSENCITSFPPEIITSDSLRSVSFVKSGWITVKEGNEKKSMYCAISVSPKKINFYDGKIDEDQQNTKLNLNNAKGIALREFYWVKAKPDNTFSLMNEQNQVIITMCSEEEEYDSWLHSLTYVLYQPVR